MVTARQIQQLTRQRLEGTVPSYPEQWLEGPMVRRERRIMNRGGILYGRRAKTLPRLKPGGSAEAPVAAKKKPTDADARLAGFAARPRSAEEKRARTERALAVIASGGGTDEHALRLPVRPLAWPRGRDEQLQTVRAIKRMLRELDAHLKSASSTLSEALPRRSVTGDGLVSVATLHAWLRSLTRAADEKRGGGARTAFDDDARFERRAEAVRKEYAKGAPLPPAVVRAMVALLDGGGTGVVALRDLVECFRVATRLAIDADAEAPALRGEATDEAKEERAKDAAAVEDAAVEDDEPVDPELAWWVDEEAEAAAARAKADADAALDKADDPAPSLAAGGAYGAVTEADVHELVDVLFSEHDELLIEELERATRALRRAWAVAHAGHRYGYANEEDAARAESLLEASYAHQPGDSAFLPAPGEDEAPFAAGPPLHASRIFAALEHYLFAREGMRFMEFVKLHCLPCGSLFNEGRGVADAFATVHEVRHVLCRLFDASSRADAARSARDAYKAARERLDALEDAARQPSASTFERHMRRSGLDAAFRKVDALIQRRGMKLKEVCELLDQDGEGRCDSSRLAAFLQAVGVRKPPPSYEIARRKHAEREAAAAAAAAERRREEADFAARMRAAEESGCVASFALMDRYFSRYQLKAEDIWTHGRAKKTTGLDRAAESHEDDSDAVGPDEFHRMLQTAKVHLSSEQVARLVAYLDTDGSGKIEHRELQAAMLDYRRFKRAKQRLELQRAERERRLFLDRQVLVLLQYLVLVGGARDAPGDAGEDQSEQFIEVAEFQRAIGRASHLPIAQYLRGIRERLHSGAYRGLAELRSSAAT